MKKKFSSLQLIFITSAFLVLFYNYTFFSKVFFVYPLKAANIPFLISIFAMLFLATSLLLTIVSFLLASSLRMFKQENVMKAFFAVIFFGSMLAAYVMDSFSTVVDETMFLNVLHTDVGETFDLLTYKLLAYCIFLFILPCFFLFKIRIDHDRFMPAFLLRIKSMGVSLVVIFAMLFSLGKFYASFFREQKPLRYYTNPTYWVYSLGKISGKFFKNTNKAMAQIGRNSMIPPGDNDRDLIILVVGETARRDRFSLNGYKKETNPLLKKENVVSFTNVTSCGTSTAISVPCIFSHFGRDKFSVENANSTENLLDVLSHTKDVEVLWRDNNSDSKGVAIRSNYEDFKTKATNPICNPECRDVGMLHGLQNFITNSKKKDIVIILHQMGNHGPAYHKRYPKEFEVFRPVCATNELEKCTNEEISNAYDNAILYTDYFLSSVIALLKNNSKVFNTGMMYISDHGESLGENGVYLHGLPYMMAPKEQKEVPLIMWFGGNMEKETNYVLLRKKINEPLSHDNVFHTILGMMEIKSSAYDPSLDFLHGVHVQ